MEIAVTLVNFFIYWVAFYLLICLICWWSEAIVFLARVILFTARTGIKETKEMVKENMRKNINEHEDEKGKNFPGRMAAIFLGSFLSSQLLMHVGHLPWEIGMAIFLVFPSFLVYLKGRVLLLKKEGHFIPFPLCFL